MTLGVPTAVRFAWRALRRQFAATAVIVCTFALAVQANLAVFAFLSSILLTDLPYPEASRVVRLWQSRPAPGTARVGIASGHFLFWSEHARSFDALAAFGQPIVEFLIETGTGSNFESVRYAVVTEEFFRVLGVYPALGRTFDHSESGRGSRVLVISDRFWRSRFGADPAIVGRSVRGLNQPSMIVGVMPPGFDYPAGVDVWYPARVDKNLLNDHTSRSLSVIGRLAPGATVTSASSEMAVLAQEIERRWPTAEKGWRPVLIGLPEEVLGPVRTGLWVLYASVLLLLLLSCTTAFNILAVQASVRRTEFGIRVALGATTRQLVAQLAAETVSMALIGTLSGFLLAWWTVHVIASQLPPGFPRSNEIKLGWAAGLVALLITVCVGLAWSVFLNWRMRRSDESKSLLMNRYGPSGLSTLTVQNALVAIGACIAFVVVVTGGISIRHFTDRANRDLGFVTDGTLVARLHLTREARARAYDILRAKAPTDGQRRTGEVDRRLPSILLVDELLAGIAEIPGTDRTAIVSRLALADQPLMAAVIPDHSTHAGDASGGGSLVAAKHSVTQGFFRTMGIPILSGRDLSRADRVGTPPVAIVNEALANRLWAGKAVLGRLITIEGESKRVEVVGIVRNTIVASLAEDPVPQVYLPYSQTPEYSLRLLVKGSNISSDLPRIRVKAEQLGFMFLESASFSDLVSRSVVQQRVAATSLGVFGLTALVLASAGIYGLVNRVVNTRMQEVRIRMALGAESRDLIGLLVGRSAIAVGVGIAAGVLLTVGLAKVLARLTAESLQADSASLVIVGVLMVISAVVAGWSPLRAAVRAEAGMLLRNG